MLIIIYLCSLYISIDIKYTNAQYHTQFIMHGLFKLIGMKNTKHHDEVGMSILEHHLSNHKI
jgi:hypothetical protein